MPLLPEYDLSGKVAILATSGGDQAPYLAMALSEAGASVFTVARRQAQLDDVLQALERGLRRRRAHHASTRKERASRA